MSKFTAHQSTSIIVYHIYIISEDLWFLRLLRMLLQLPLLLLVSLPRLGVRTLSELHFIYTAAGYYAQPQPYYAPQPAPVQVQYAPPVQYVQPPQTTVVVTQPSRSTYSSGYGSGYGSNAGMGIGGAMLGGMVLGSMLKGPKYGYGGKSLVFPFPEAIHAYSSFNYRVSRWLRWLRWWLRRRIRRL